MTYHFKTIQKPVKNILMKEKGSKFIGFAFPINSEEELKRNLEKLKAEHPKATHHCYAFRLGLKGENYRANDDGEPSGSAGLPIYNQLLANEITNILLVVIRYYGGTKLGVSGLVKAYKETSKLTIDEAEIITKELEAYFDLKFDFNQQNTIFTILNKLEAKILSFDADNICNIKFSVKKNQESEIEKQFSEIKHIELSLS